MAWYLNRRGEQLWYEDVGTGSPVVFVHGWCMSSVIWKFQFAGLSGSLRIVAPDLRGHGRSRGITGHLTFKGFSDDLIDLFAHLKLENALVVGWSMGAQIVLQAYADLSGRLAGMVLLSATPRFTASDDFPFGVSNTEVRGMHLKVERNTERALTGFYSRLFTEGEPESDARRQQIGELLATIPAPDAGAVLEALDALATTDMRPLLATITTPVLVVNGEHDRICLPQASRYLATHIPNAEQTVFPHAGHAPFLSYSDRFNAEILRFIRSVSEYHV